MRRWEYLHLTIAQNLESELSERGAEGVVQVTRLTCPAALGPATVAA